MSFFSFKQQLASPKLSWQLCLLAIVGGFAAAMLIVLFTLTIRTIQQFYLTEYDNYTSLDGLSRFDLPIIGALVILFFSWLTGYKFQRTGIPFVLHRLKVAYGAIPFRNTLHQFIGGAVSLSTGFSVGKEGPVVHLGAAASSFIGVKLALPNNSIRTLCACGIAAGIAASFNTPIAAVLFVMEVILREYDMQMFIPIMLAAIMGSMVTSNIFGTSHDYEFISQIALTHQDFLILALLGVFIGVFAATFNHIIIFTIKKFEKFHIITRLMLAALITGSLGYLVPHAMGTGISAVAFSVEHNNQLMFIASLFAAKLLMTVLVIGLGMPGGLVGPILGVGAVSGILGALILEFVIPGNYIGSDFALIGMAGFMAATLNAPLAALITVIELSNQLTIVLPAMIVIVASCLISGQLFKNRSVFAMQLDMQNLVYRKPPIETALQRVGVLSQLNTNIKVYQHMPSDDELQSLDPQQAVIVKSPDHQQPHYQWLERHEAGLSPQDKPYCLHTLHSIFEQATLSEAYLLLLHQRSGGVYVYDHESDDILGIITFEQIKEYLLQGNL